MISESAGVDIGRLEIMTESEHRKKRSIAGFVTIVIFKLSLSKFRTCRRLGCNEPGLALTTETMSQERKGYASEIGTSTEASYHDIRIIPRLLHLLFCLKTDYGLMKGHMVHH